MKTKGLLIILVALAAALMFTRGLDAASGRSVQDVYVVGPAELDPGSSTAFRVVVMEAKSLTDAKPVPGALVSLVLSGGGRNYSVLQSRTDGRGTLNATARVPDVKAGDDWQLKVAVESSLGKTEKSHPVRITPRYRVLLTTDKPLYQPGQLIHLRAVALKVADLTPVAKTDVTLMVEDPQGNKVFKKIGKTDGYGIFAADFQLADEIRLGDYKISAIVGDKSAEKAVKVDRYVLPKFKVTLDTDKSYYKPGDKVKGTVSAKYFFGKDVSGGKVKVSAQAFDYEFHQVAEVTGVTDQSGNFEFELTLPESFVGQPLEQGDAFVRIDAEVMDKAEHTERATVQRKVAAADLRIEMVPEAGVVLPGVENLIYAVVSTPDDAPSPGARVKIMVGSRTFISTTDEAGIAEVAFTPESGDFQEYGYQDYVINVSGEAEAKNGAKAQADQQFHSQSMRDSILLRTDRAIYTSGQDMKVDVFSTYSVGSVYLDLIKNRQTVLTRALDINSGHAASTVAIPPDLFGTVELHAYVILATGEIMRDTRVVYIEPSDDLKITVDLDKDTYRPGEKAVLMFSVRDKEGRGKAAALGLSIVDEAVFAIQEMQPGLLKVYFTLEKEIATPRYEVHTAPFAIESAVNEEQEDIRRDRAMKVVLAGVKNPTAMDWVENPAAERMQKEQERMRAFATQFGAWAKDHDFLDRSGGKWVFRRGAVEAMIKDGAIKKDDAYDSFGNPYDPAMLTAVDPTLEVNNFAKVIASYRLLMIYSGIEKMALEDESFVRKFFDGVTLPKMDSAVLDRLVEKKYLNKGQIIDPWGKRYIVQYSEKETGNPYNSNFNHHVIKSAGPDGKPDNVDDMADPWYCTQSGYLYIDMFQNDDSGYFTRFIPLPAMAGAGAWDEEMAIPEAAPRKANGDGMREFKAMAKEEAATTGPKDGGGAEPVRVREYFPETLLWEPALITDAAGKGRLELDMADSITTWRMTALGHSMDGLVGSATSGIRVFQDFFVDIDFPVQLTQDDEVSVPVAVYNYLPGSQRVKLEVREHDGFDLLSDASQELSLTKGQVDVRYFRVKAKKLGKQTLTVYATGSKMSDAIRRSVDIIPNGLRVEVVKNGRITGNLDETINVPNFAIPDSSRVMVKIYPGVFAQVLEGLDNIFRMPSGCFEQTTSTTYPNVMVLSYMKKTKTVSPEIQMKAEGFINLGYQRLLSFEVPGGGFEWFGNPPANKVLTAYGLMEFSDMSKVYQIDTAVITRTQEWLARQQEADGSWKPVEHWMETLSGEAFSRSNMLNTAYITWALADTGYKGEATRKGIKYIKDHRKEIEDAYTLALVVNALVSADPKDRDALDMLSQLDRAKVEDAKTGAAHWEPKGETAVHGGGKTAQIETTSLILYAMIKAGVYAPTVNKGLAWIGQQRDAFGTFESTQATVLSMKALLAAEEGGAPDVNGEINVSLNGRDELVKITPADSDVLRLIDFKDKTKTGDNTVSLKVAKDLGLMYQVVGIFYVPWDMVEKVGVKPVLSLDVKYGRRQLAANDILTATVTAEYLGDKATDMVILDLGLPPGFTLIPDALDKLIAGKQIEKYTVTGRQITVYVRRMEKGKPLKFSYQLKAKFPVKAVAPKSTVYEYYNPANKFEQKGMELEITK